ncbi:hypothetical protein [Streptomyces sp. Y7]|uniref:hypothetical protein n=1 Tax=Streptomyces sp. Y7 TaxID=3342392 RepID=UPI003719895D
MAADWGDVAGWVGGVAGVAAFATSVIGLFKSGDANRLAKEANELSRVANAKSAESNLIARKANRLSEEANGFAREANEMADRQEQRSVEIHDVRWEGSWAAPGEYVVLRRGRSIAYNVVAQVRVDEEEVSIERDEVGPDERLLFDFPQARATLVGERAEYQRGRSRASSHPYGVAYVNAFEFWNHEIEEVVQWQTESGAPKEHRESFSMSSLGDLE